MFMKCNFPKVLSCLVLLLAFSSQGFAASQATAFGDRYTPVAAVTSSQSQVVVFRAGQPRDAGSAANVHVDKEFHTGLLPGGVTAFCVAPGTHSLLAFMNGDPSYSGKKREDLFVLKAGETVFIRVNADGSGLPQIVPRIAAERELANSRRQVHLVSRASAIVDCAFSPPLSYSPPLAPRT